MLVPRVDNAGQAFSLSIRLELERRLIELRPSYSIRPDVAGVWTGPTGRVFHDTSEEVTVALDSWFELAGFLDVVVWACAAFDQEAIYFEVSGFPR